MVQGYIGSRPDSAWWLAQIQAGEEFRKRAAFELKWKIWRNYYRGEWAPDIMPVNLFFTMMRTMVPRIYFRNPSISIMPSKPGLLNMTFSRVLERIDNKMLRQMEYKKMMKRMVRDTIMKGTGIGKLGFGGYYSPTAEIGPLPVTARGDKVEYLTTAQADMPWFARVDPKNFVVPAGLDDFNLTRWTAEKIMRPLEDVVNDPRFTNTSGLKTTTEFETFTGSIHRPLKQVKLWEIRDWKTGKVFVIAPDHSRENKVLFFEDDAFQRYNGFNYFPLVFNEDDEVFWGLPDSQIMEPYQLELNEIRTQQMKHRRVSLVKVLVKRGGMDPSEAEKLVSEDVQAVAWISGQGSVDSSVKILQQSTIPAELFAAAEQVTSDTRETLGMGRNQMGEFAPKRGTTATEATIVSQALEIRVDEKRDAVADLTVEMIEMLHFVFFDNWGAEQIVDVVGPGGVPVWIKLRPELLRTGQYNIRIDPDSSLPETRALREQRALLLFQQLKTNPLVDPIKLTQYLLHELKGPQFDDMMRMLPMPGDGPPRGPVGPGEFANLLGHSFDRLAVEGPRPLPENEEAA